MRVLIIILLTVLVTNCLKAQTAITFRLEGADVSQFKKVGIRGDQSPLSWESSIPMKKEGDHYVATVSFDEDIDALQYKFVRYNSDKKLDWESIPNRKLQILDGSKAEVSQQWNTADRVDIISLQKIPAAVLQEDFQLIKTMILDVHPGTYRYASKATITAALLKLENTFKKDLTHGAAYLAVSEALAAIQCDHTFASYYNQSPLLKAVIHEQPDKLPFTFSWVSDRMIVKYNISEQELPFGSEIVAINGVTALVILQQLMTYVRADGATDQSRVSQLEVDGYPYRYNGFDVFFPLVYEVSDRFDLTVRDPDGKTRQLVVNAVTRSERAKQLKEKYPDFAFDKADLWGYQRINDNTGLLKAGTFDDYGMDRDWRAYFASVFKQINSAGIEHLIVDLRENQGGFDEIGVGLMRHLIKESAVVEDFVNKSRYRIFPEVLKPHTSSWGTPWYHQMQTVADLDEEGYYLLPPDKQEAIRPAKNCFKGKVYFLVGPANVSMAYYLMRGAKKYDVGTLIGEETGGNQQGINGGQIIFLRLPNSQIEIDFPVEGSFAKESGLPNRGIVPHLEVLSQVKEVIAGRDMALEAALNLIEEESDVE
ncbi:MAG: S41 family peptidase [Bacteroidota bacterium]